MATRHVIAGSVVAGASACSLLYAGYDGRFQDASATTLPFVVDPSDASITALAVTQSDLFYGAQSAIHRVPLDGGEAGVWWNAADGGTVSEIVSDGTGRLAWVLDMATGGPQLLTAQVVNPAAASPVSVLPKNFQVAASSTRLVWGEPTCQPSKCCKVASAMPWGGAAAPLDLCSDAGGPLTLNALSVDTQGITAFVTGAGMVRFGDDGGSCSAMDFSVYVVATAPTGTPTFEGKDLPSVVLRDSTFGSASCQRSEVQLPSNLQSTNIVVDDAAAYWLDTSSNLATVSFVGDASTVLSSVPGASGPIAADDRFVYVISGSSIYRVSKPTGQ